MANTSNTTNTTMATHTYTMPAARHHTAPKFSAEQPRELKHYFEELENLMSQAGITADAEKKKQAVRYLDVDAWTCGNLYQHTLQGITKLGLGW